MPQSNADTARHEFTSFHSGVDESEFAITVGFSRDPVDDSSIDGLLLQRGRGSEDDTPEIEGVYVEIPIQRHAVYGGITEAILQRDTFTLRFEELTARKMGDFHEIVVRFNLPDDQFTSIREALQFVFTSCSCYHDETRIGEVGS
jgi:hypothetical protein